MLRPGVYHLLLLGNYPHIGSVDLLDNGTWHRVVMVDDRVSDQRRNVVILPVTYYRFVGHGRVCSGRGRWAVVPPPQGLGRRRRRGLPLLAAPVLAVLLHVSPGPERVQRLHYGLVLADDLVYPLLETLGAAAAASDLVLGREVCWNGLLRRGVGHCGGPVERDRSSGKLVVEVGMVVFGGVLVVDGSPGLDHDGLLGELEAVL